MRALDTLITARRLAKIVEELRGRRYGGHRATSRGGSLQVRRPRDASPGLPERFEMTVSTTLLFESFHDGQRSIRIAGHECADRLDALQRIVEHETVHLVEHLRWRMIARAVSPPPGAAPSPSRRSSPSG